MKKDTTVNKYLGDLKTAYAKKIHYTGEDSSTFQNNWNDYKRELINKLIEKEKIHYNNQ